MYKSHVQRSQPLWTSAMEGLEANVVSTIGNLQSTTHHTFAHKVRLNAIIER